MAFDIREHMWEIFNISCYNDLENIRIALELFLMNVELKKERYRGSPKTNFEELNKAWNELSEGEKNKQKRMFNRLINRHYGKLWELYSERRRDLFEDVCRTEEEQ